MISCDVILCDMIRYFTIWYDMLCISWDKMSDSMSDKFSKHWPHWGSFAGSNLFGGPYWCGLLVGETSEWPQFSFRRDFRLKVFTFRSWIFLNILIYCVYIYIWCRSMFMFCHWHDFFLLRRARVALVVVLLLSPLIFLLLICLFLFFSLPLLPLLPALPLFPHLPVRTLQVSRRVGASDKIVGVWRA